VNIFPQLSKFSAIIHSHFPLKSKMISGNCHPISHHLFPIWNTEHAAQFKVNSACYLVWHRYHFAIVNGRANCEQHVMSSAGRPSNTYAKNGRRHSVRFAHIHIMPHLYIYIQCLRPRTSDSLRVMRARRSTSNYRFIIKSRT
jgi:hypothetical protein